MKKVICITLAVMLLCLPLTACAESPPAAELPDVPSTELPAEPTPPNEPAPEQPSEPTPTPPAEPEPEPPAEPTPPPVKKAQYVLVLQNGLNIRTGASTSHASLGQLEGGTLLQYVRTTNGWYQTHYQNRVAYVSASPSYTKLLSLEQTDDKTEAVISRGLKFLGIPYVYGAVRYHDGTGNKLKGFTANKFDCSSLMQYIFYLGTNTVLGTTTRTQVLQGTRVKGEIQRGDLLFFTNSTRYNNKGIERVGHVALYLGGNYILHTASDFAKIEQISAKRWSYYLEARRFF